MYRYVSPLRCSVTELETAVTRSIAMQILVVTVLSFPSQVLARYMLCNVNKLNSNYYYY